MLILPTYFLIAFVAGAWLLQQQAELPPAPWALSVLGLALVAVVVASRTRVVIQVIALSFAGVVLGFVWSAWRAELRLVDHLPREWEVRDIMIVGTVAGMPDRVPRGQRFEFEVEQVETDGARVPRRILLSWYAGYDRSADADAISVRPGQRWRLQVRLRRPHGNANPHGFDYEALLIEQDIGASGYVRGANQAPNRLVDEFVLTPAHLIEALRFALRARIENALPRAPYAGVIVALVVGDQRAIPQSDWQVFARTGISHLISISGLHVTMLAGLGARLAYLLWRWMARRRGQLPLGISGPRAAALAGALVALVYCLLAGMGVPAQRTLIMLCIVAAALWMQRLVGSARVLSVALFVVVLIDPWAVLSAGFWLSFGAVALIFYVGTGRIARHAIAAQIESVVPEPALRARMRRWRSALRPLLVEAARMQWAVTLGLVPFTLLLFQQVSLVSPLANAIAIPLISFVVTPLSLLGAVLPGPAGTLLLALAHFLVSVLASALAVMSAWSWAAWQAAAAPPWAIALGMLGVVWALAPRGFPLRALGGLALVPAFLWPTDRPAAGHLRVVMFDAGQGSAVLIETREHRFLYDTGPYYSPEADGGSRVVVPYLRARGIASLDGLIVTHNDNDHSGGALSVLSALPVGWMSSSLWSESPIVRRAARPLRCEAGQTWVSAGFRFTFLHPAPQSYRRAGLKPNARSCVLRIAALDDSVPTVLLTGDIERAQELELTERVPRTALRADVLLVPHHGSLTSSSPLFLDAVAPRLAVVQAGYLNRFQHPRPDVLARYRERGITLARTDRDGAVIVDLGPSALQMQAWRAVRVRYWQGR